MENDTKNRITGACCNEEKVRKIESYDADAVDNDGEGRNGCNSEEPSKEKWQCVKSNGEDIRTHMLTRPGGIERSFGCGDMHVVNACDRRPCVWHVVCWPTTHVLRMSVQGSSA